MSFDNVNLLSVVIGAAAAMAIGALWYSPGVFGNRWQALMGKTTEEPGSPVGSMLIATVMFLLLGVGLSWIIPEGADLAVSLMWAFLAFWAFVLPATVINGAFERRGWALMTIYLGYMLVATLVIGAIIGFLGG